MNALPNITMIVVLICLLSGVKCNSVISSAVRYNATKATKVTEECHCYALCCCDLRLSYVLWLQRHDHCSLCLYGNCDVMQ